MTHDVLIPTADFPSRQSNHRGRWMPLYMEPIAGTGERICIGVAAQDQLATIVKSVDDLSRLACAYGDQAHAFAWAAQLALMEAQDRVSKDGLTSLAQWEHSIEGLSVGASREGAGRDLGDLASLALLQVSSLARTVYLGKEESFVEGVADALTSFADLVPYGVSRDAAPQLESQVKRLVVHREPRLRDHFGTVYRTSQAARPLRFGYVGRLLAANFASLTARTSSHASMQVDKAKARLWDLNQLKSGVLADSLPLKATSLSYELLVLRPFERIRDIKMPLAKVVREAEEELTAEADKFDIRFRPLNSSDDIAREILKREAA